MSKRFTTRVLSVEPSFDLGSIVRGQQLADEILKRRNPEASPDPRPSIGNVAVAVTLKTEGDLRRYIEARHSNARS